MRSCLTLTAVAALLALGLGSPLVQATHNFPPTQPLALAVTPVASSVYPGENATWNVTVRNPSELLPRDVALSVTSQLPTDWTYELAPTLNVPANSEAWTTLKIVVPSNAQAQVVSFVVEASDGSHFTRENATITVKSRPASGTQATLPPPVLGISVSTGDSGPSGSVVEGELVIHNEDELRTVTVQVRPISRDGWAPYAVTPDRVIGPGQFQTVALRVEVPPLSENTSKTFDISVVPTEGPASTAQWTVVGIAPQQSGVFDPASDATSEPSTSSSTTTSGSTSTVPTRAPGPGLDVFVEPVEIDVISGADTSVVVRLVNTGSTALIVDLVGTPPASWPAFVFDPATAVSLAPGEEARVDMRISAPAGIPPGGSARGAVSAIAESGGLARRAGFLLHVIDAVPADTSSAATVEAPVSPDASEAIDGDVALVVVGLAALGAGAAVVASRPLREKLLWGAAGLYTRLARPDVLGHEDREKLYRLVETTPGIHFHALQRDLGWNTGTLTYHLRVLEKHGFVVSRRDGLYRRFYLSGAAPRKETFENQGPTGLRADVLEAVRTQPGISQSDLALGLSANKQTVNYHVKALERAGTIRVEKRGRDTYLYPGDASAPTAGPTPPQDKARV